MAYTRPRSLTGAVGGVNGSGRPTRGSSPCCVHETRPGITRRSQHSAMRSPPCAEYSGPRRIYRLPGTAQTTSKFPPTYGAAAPRHSPSPPERRKVELRLSREILRLPRKAKDSPGLGARCVARPRADWIERQVSNPCFVVAAAINACSEWNGIERA